MKKINVKLHINRICLIFMSCILSCILFTSCGNRGEAEDDGTVSLQIWEGFKFEEHTIFEELCRNFEKDYEKTHGVKVKLTPFRVPFDDMMTKIKTATLSYTTPDICFVDALKVIELAYGDVIFALDKLPNFKGSLKNMEKEFVPAAFGSNLVNVKGETHLYGLPAQTTCLALFWNRKLFRRYANDLKKAGCDPNRPPEDWEEFIKYGKALTHPDDGIYAFGMRNSLWFTMPFFNLFGAAFVEEKDGKFVSTVNSKKAIAAIQLKVDLALKYGIEGGAWKAGAKDPDQGFLNESYAMILTGPWNVEKFKSSGLDLGIALIPKLSKKQAIDAGLLAKNATDEEYSKKITSSSNVGGQNSVIFTTCRHPEVAYAFLEFFTSKKIQKYWSEKLGQIPVRLEAQEGLDTSVFPEIVTFIDQINLARPMPPLPLYGTLEMDVFNPEIDLVLNGKKSVEDAMASIDRGLTKKILSKVNEE
jgi:multiple sugar transport system substrate-binding protein